MCKVKIHLEGNNEWQESAFLHPASLHKPWHLCENSVVLAVRLGRECEEKNQTKFKSCYVPIFLFFSRLLYASQHSQNVWRKTMHVDINKGWSSEACLTPPPQHPQMQCFGSLKSQKYDFEKFGFQWAFLYPASSLFLASHLPQFGAARHVPHLGYLTNWHSTTWSVQLSLSNTRSVVLQDIRSRASVRWWACPGRYPVRIVGNCWAFQILLHKISRRFWFSPWSCGWKLPLEWCLVLGGSWVPWCWTKL